ncbi:low molecular weight protein-tyrosine-phosphatase [Flavobacterium sp. JP2137]|uniref:low molecular weight protein-tyrosine-phosphatase n=1 Tax=Flavobacterium sp. JP2137 TaxID=3414510 RepID=UPI003D2FF4D8
MTTKILMVCLGNICRSPLAEGILQAKLPMDLFEVDSAGTGDWHVGQTPDKRSIAIAQKNKIDLSAQRARQFQVSDFETFDYIYMMDRSNYSNVIAMAPHQQAIDKVQLILDEHPKSHLSEVPDPYFGGDDGFEQVYQLLDEVCHLLSKKLLEH